MTNRKSISEDVHHVNDGKRDASHRRARRWSMGNEPHNLDLRQDRDVLTDKIASVGRAQQIVIESAHEKELLPIG